MVPVLGQWGKWALRPNSYLDRWDYALRFVGWLDLLKAELEEAGRSLPRIWVKPSLWCTFSTKYSLVLAQLEPMGWPQSEFQKTWPLSCLKTIKGCLQFILNWIFLKPDQRAQLPPWSEPSGFSWEIMGCGCFRPEEALWAGLSFLSVPLKWLKLVALKGFPGGASGKEPTCQSRRHKRHKFHPWLGKIPWRRASQPTPVFLLENPVDRGVWQATVHGVTESQTWRDWSDVAAAAAVVLIKVT